jgi:hypothetical protein
MGPPLKDEPTAYRSDRTRVLTKLRTLIDLLQTFRAQGGEAVWTGQPRLRMAACPWAITPK